jgi:hypothetical protein
MEREREREIEKEKERERDLFVPAYNKLSSKIFWISWY